MGKDSRYGKTPVFDKPVSSVKSHNWSSFPVFRIAVAGDYHFIGVIFHGERFNDPTRGKFHFLLAQIRRLRQGG